MEITGKIIAVLPLQTGTGKNEKEWKKQEFVIETHDQYPKKMCFNLWGDRIEQFNIQINEELTVSFDVDCREWQGKWFNDIRAWKVDRISSAVNSDNAAPQTDAAPVQQAQSDGLPF